MVNTAAARKTKIPYATSLAEISRSLGICFLDPRRLNQASSASGAKIPTQQYHGQRKRYSCQRLRTASRQAAVGGSKIELMGNTESDAATCRAEFSWGRRINQCRGNRKKMARSNP